MEGAVQFYIGTKLGDEELKCFITFIESSLKYNVIKNETKSNVKLPYLLLPNNEILHQSNTICKYVAHTSTKLQASDLLVQEWIEWEERELNKMKTKLDKENTSKNKDALEALLAAKDECFKSTYLVANTLSLADIIVGVTLKSVLVSLPSASLPKIRQYLENLYKLPSFLQSSSSVSLATSPVNSKKGNDAVKKAKKPQFKKIEAKRLSKSILNEITDLFMDSLYRCFPASKEISNLNTLVTRATNPKFGDYQCNAAMSTFKLLKASMPEAGIKSPLDIAKALVADLKEKNYPIFSELQVAPPGFVNVFLSDTFVSSRLKKLLVDGVHCIPVEKMSICVDFSSPNIAKEMHVGHLRSTILGDTMSRILEFQGHQVYRINHIGDWGTQFGMLICYLIDDYPDIESNLPNLTDLTQIYKAAKKRFDEVPEFKERSRISVSKLQKGDPTCVRIWKLLCQLSRIEFEKVYKRLGVTITECGESFYNDKIPQVISILEEKNLTSYSDGALVVFTEISSQPLMMKKKDGSYLYDSTDVAAVWYRTTELKADWLIYYVDFSQSDHFKLVFETCGMADILKEDKHRVEHVGFGTVNDESGHRFKTRSGDTVRLVELLDEAKDRMKAQLLQRIEQKATTLSLDKVEESAEALGYGAVKYFDLRQAPTSNYIFSFDRMLSTNGDTAVYLMFAYARLSSILRKSGKDIFALKLSHEIELKHPTEKILGVELLQFQDVLLFVSRDLMTNRLCSYLYSVSEKVQTFVTACHVIGSEEECSRLLLAQATLDIMKTCFTLLGIQPLEQI